MATTTYSGIGCLLIYYIAISKIFTFQIVY